MLSLEGEEDITQFKRNYPNDQTSPKLHFNYISSSGKKPQFNANSAFNDFDDSVPQFFSENIEESPLKKDYRLSDERSFKIPEFPYNENNIKSGKRVNCK